MERFIKEIRKRSEVLVAFPSPDAPAKNIYFMALEMNERYRLKALKDFYMVKEELLSVKRAKQRDTIEVTDLCYIQILDTMLI